MARHFIRASSQSITLSSLPDLTTALSYSCWFRNLSSPGSFPNRNPHILKGGNGGADINYLVNQDNANIGLIWTTASSSYHFLTCALTPDTGVWHHIALATDFSGSGSLVYIDGVSQTVSDSAGTPEINNTDQGIGVFYSERMDGDLAHICLWNVKLSAGELASLFRFYPYNVRPGSIVFSMPLWGLASPEPEMSGKGNSGTLVNAPTYSIDPPITLFTPRWPIFSSIAAAPAYVSRMLSVFN